MTARVLQITDGTDTIDFESASSGYTIVPEGWTPAVAEKDGGPEGYTIVEEEIRLFVEGDDADEAATRLALLRRLIEQAQRKDDGDLVDAVVIKYNVDGSTLTTPLQAFVMGPENGDILTLPKEYDSAIASTKIGTASDPVIWRFRRRGLWLGATETAQTSIGNQTAPTLNAVSYLTATDELSPIDFQIKVNGSNLDAGDWPDTTIIITPFSNIYMLEPEGELTTGSEFTSVADSTNKASGGSVLRYTPPDTSINQSGPSNSWIGGWGSSRPIRHVGFWANIRNNSATTVFKIRAVCNYSTGGAYTKWTYIPVSQVPTWLYLGSFASNIDYSQFWLEAQATAAAGSLDIDSIAVIGLDNDQTTILSFTPDISGTNITASLELMLTHRLLTDTAPSNYWRNASGSRFYIPYTGVGRVLMRADTPTQGGNMHVALLAAGKPSATNQWRWTDSAGNPVTFGLTATRRPGYVVPR